MMFVTAEERAVRDISMVWDNDEGCHIFIKAMVKRSSSAWELAQALREFYEISIDEILRETPERSAGNMLIREMCFYIPVSVFDTLAETYWEDLKEFDDGKS
jgi:hypothetical protein